jgi:hypothetical protein
VNATESGKAFCSKCERLELPKLGSGVMIREVPASEVEVAEVSNSRAQ